LNKGQIQFGFSAFFGQLHFLWRFGRFKDDFGRLLALEDF